MAFVLTVLLATIIFLAAALYLKYRHRMGHWKRLGVETFHPPSLMSNILTGKMNFVQLELDAYNSVKGKKFGGYFEFWNPVLYVTDLDIMKHILIKDFDHFVDRRGFDVEKNDPHSHLSLFNQAGEDWKELRSKMSPTFTTGKIRRMFQIFDSSAQKLVKAVKARTSDEMDIKDFHGKVTMDIIASAAFGIQTDLFEDPDSYFAQMGKKIQQQFAGKNIAKVFFIVLTPKLAEIFNVKLTDSDADKFFTKAIVDSLNSRAKTGSRRDDFLQLMLEARQGTLKQEEESQLDEHEKSARLQNQNTSRSKIDFSDDLIIAQCLLFILGGFDTVESCLVWAMYCLMTNPEVQEKLHEEVRRSYEANDNKFTYDSIASMDYLDRFLQETLRMFPPAVRLERRSVKAYQIPGTNIVLPKDTLVQVPNFGLHRDPDLWPEPEKFDPDRFLKENVLKRHPCAFLPFGAGPRNCIGNRFALVECKVILAYLSLNFKFETCSKTTIPPKFADVGGVKPLNGMWTRVSDWNEE